ncbi:hypothetical protein JG687_00012845 [Phytophthora cactorum]|uniref:Uncharacterized protein n=1 Tax=Phytophthora cactorum TaxID=29920 RepID=A0A8T1U1W3_9STRA|nr:hypothetical protein PC120_g20250 [Phytophthora cactorum]KAG3049540.1 hypothetical protein PC121_g18877 [Phytophthora cactorum]KAG6952689.1 hypothetical protein JG687_00012845 [Phytophthora cactorum]
MPKEATVRLRASGQAMAMAAIETTTDVADVVEAMGVAGGLLGGLLIGEALGDMGGDGDGEFAGDFKISIVISEQLPIVVAISSANTCTTVVASVSGRQQKLDPTVL